MFVILNGVWSGMCKDQLQDFSKLVEKCNKTTIRRKHVQRLQNFLDVKKTDRENRQSAIDAPPSQEQVIEVRPMFLHVIFLGN